MTVDNTLTIKAYPSLLTGSSLDIFGVNTEFILHENVFVDSKSGLIGKDSSDLDQMSLTEYVWWNPFWIENDSNFKNNKKRIIDERIKIAQTLFDDRFSTKKHTYLDQEPLYVSLLHPHARYSFGHLFDTLAKLVILLENYKSFDEIVFLVADHKLIIDFEKYLKILLGINMPRFISNRAEREDGFDFWFCKKVLSIKPQSRPANLNKQSYTFIREQFNEAFPASSYNESKKLFLARRHPNDSRYICNIEDLEIVLSQLGVKILYGNEPLEDIYHFFSNASHVSGYHGSLFANTLFCQKNAKVLEFCSKNRPDSSFMTKYKDVEDYCQIFIETDLNNNAVIDPVALKFFFES